MVAFVGFNVGLEEVFHSVVIIIRCLMNRNVQINRHTSFLLWTVSRMLTITSLFLFQPFAWEAREFLRKKLIGKEVAFYLEYKVPGSGREYGAVYLGRGVICTYCYY